MNGLPFLQKPFTATARRDAIQVALGPKVSDGFHKSGKAAKGDAHQIAEASARSHIVSAIIPRTSRNSAGGQAREIARFSYPTESGVVQWVCNGE